MTQAPPPDRRDEYAFEDSTDTADAPSPAAVHPAQQASAASTFADETDVNAAAGAPFMPDWLRKRPPPLPSALSIGETTGEVRLVEGQAPTPFSPAPVPPRAPIPIEELSPPTHAASAARGGAAAASNAAAELSRPAPEEPHAPRGAAEEASRRLSSSRAPVQLLWFDRDVAQRVRARAGWAPILKSLEDQPLDREADDYDARFSTQAIEDRRAVSEILSVGEPSSSAFADLLNEAIQRAGRFVPPLVLLSGDLEPTFDERATLTAVTSFVEPFRASDDELRSALDDAHALLRLPGSTALAPEVCASLADRVRKAFLRKRGGTAHYVEEQIARALMRERAYARRRVLGGDHLRMTFRAGPRSAPAYLPNVVSDLLPMFSRVHVRLIAEIEPRADGAEESPVSLRVGALARSLAAQ
ncbi:MAG: hypothetical protein U0414_09445 [Polyangiaceae bacterium]